MAQTPRQQFCITGLCPDPRATGYHNMFLPHGLPRLSMKVITRRALGQRLGQTRIFANRALSSVGSTSSIGPPVASLAKAAVCSHRLDP